MKILFIARTYGAFNLKKDYLTLLIDHLEKQDHVIDIYDPKKRIYFNINKEKAGEVFKVPSFIMKIKPAYFIINIIALATFLYNRRKDYSVVHFFNIRYELLFISNVLPLVKAKKIGTLYGGEYYLNPIRKLFAFIYKKFDLLTCQKDELKRDIINYYGKHVSVPIKILPMPVTAFHKIDYLNNSLVTKSEIKEQFNIDPDSKVIVCGTNANKNEQHEMIIDNLLGVNKEKKVTFIFPLTYDGPKDYIDKVKNKIQSKLFGYSVKIFLDFMSLEEVTRLRFITDIFINIRKTDQFNIAMLESLYAGSYLIYGKWLQYDLIKRQKLNYSAVNTNNDIGSIINKLIYDDELLMRYANENKHNVRNLGHPNNVLPLWESVYRTI